MIDNITKGLSTTMEINVTDNDTAKRYASGSIEVFATPAMIALMENASKTLVDKFLQTGDTTVGTEINVKHIKATPVGMKVKCEATIEEVSGRQIKFNVKAWDEKGLIGEGTHTRFIVNVEKFMGKLG